MIRGLGDYKKEEKKKKNSTSYAGGEKSGLAVENPDVEGILAKAKEKKKDKEEEKYPKQKDPSKPPKTELKISLY